MKVTVSISMLLTLAVSIAKLQDTVPRSRPPLAALGHCRPRWVPAGCTPINHTPATILQGGIVVPLFPPDSPYLTPKIREPEVYNVSRSVGGGFRLSIFTTQARGASGRWQPRIPGPSSFCGRGRTQHVERGDRRVGLRALFNYGVNTVILRNRLPRWLQSEDRRRVTPNKIAGAGLRQGMAADPHKIGIMIPGWRRTGMPAAYSSTISTRPTRTRKIPWRIFRTDFVGIVYPGPTPFARAHPPLFHGMPPAFIICPGSKIRNTPSGRTILEMLEAGAQHRDAYMHTASTGSGSTAASPTAMAPWHRHFARRWMRP